MNEITFLGKRSSEHSAKTPPPQKKPKNACEDDELALTPWLPPDLISHIAIFLDLKSLLNFELASKLHLNLTSFSWKKLNEKKAGLFFRASEEYSNIHRANYFIDKLVFEVFGKTKNLNDAKNYYEFLINRFSVVKEILECLFLTNPQVVASLEEAKQYTGEGLLLAYSKLKMTQSSESELQASDLHNRGLDLLKDLMQRVSAQRVAFFARHLLSTSTFFTLCSSDQECMETLIMEEKAENYDQLTQLSPTFPAHALYKGLTSLADQNNIQMLEDQALEIYKGKETPFYYFFMFKLKAELTAQDTNYYAEAEEAFNALIEHCPRGYYPEAVSQILSIKAQVYKWEEAERIFDRFSQVYPTVPQVLYYGALAKSGLRKYDEAAAIFKQYFHSVTEDTRAEIYANYGLHKVEHALQLKQMQNFPLAYQRFEEAIAAYQKAADIDYDYFTPFDLCKFGLALMECRKWREANIHYNAALEMEEEVDEKTLTPVDYRAAALVKAKVRLWDPAEILYEKILPYFQEDVSLLSEIALVKFSKNKQVEAKQLYEKALQLDPSLRTILINTLLVEPTAQLQEQFQHWDSLYSNQPTSETLEIKAFHALKEQKYDRAEDLFDEITVQRPFSYKALFVAAYLKMRGDKWDLAEVLFERAFRLMPIHPSESRHIVCAFLCQRALNKMQLQKWSEADSFFSHAIASYPEYLTSKCLCDAACVKVKCGNWEQANDLFKRNLFLFNTISKNGLENFLLVKQQLNLLEEAELIAHLIENK
ncbi:MAG: tetratricopeptide repeat protein [Parachlamydiaceae bacterium]